MKNGSDTPPFRYLAIPTPGQSDMYTKKEDAEAPSFFYNDVAKD